MTSFENRLAREKSPYLLQHAHNPVDWYPWGEEAFARARSEDKPVILSIGYSTCHWCHVMEHESFSNEQTARVMNEDFISIKVDREERPDLDHLYMNYVQATTGGGGWPMTVFLTPGKKPFYGGTYFPPQDRYGMPGFESLLRSIALAWKERREEIDRSADSAAVFLAGDGRASERAEIGPGTLDESARAYAAAFDADRGGFTPAPKFPRADVVSSLLRQWSRVGDERALEMAEISLRRMAEGGMNDQLAGGFHRYSTDALWRVPHFEKMLYDQALLTGAYVEAFQATADPFYSRVARQTLEYALRDMTSGDGVFYSAEDADSADPADPGVKREGAFYVWRKDEIDRVLGKDADLFCYRFGIEPGGNAPSDPHGEFVGQNVLYAAHSAAETAARFGKTRDELEEILERARLKILQARAARPRPLRDEKILTDWNALMITALAQAAGPLEEPRYAAAAARAGRFILSRLRTADGRLLHRYRDGEAGIAGHLDDYAFMLEACLALYEATFDAEWIESAKSIGDRLFELFWDESQGGFFLTESGATDLLVRPKEVYDGATPSGNSVAALSFLKLSRLTGEMKYEDIARRTLEAFSGRIATTPTAFARMLAALDFSAGLSCEIVIASASGDDRESVLNVARAIHRIYVPNKVMLWHADRDAGERLRSAAPFVRGKTPVDGRLTVYVCSERVCRAPITELSRLTEFLPGTRRKTKPSKRE